MFVVLQVKVSYTLTWIPYRPYALAKLHVKKQVCHVAVFFVLVTEDIYQLKLHEQVGNGTCVFLYRWVARILSLMCNA